MTAAAAARSLDEAFVEKDYYERLSEDIDLLIVPDGTVLACNLMKTFRLDPTAAGDQAAAVAGEIDKLLREGRRVAVTIAEEQELLSPQQAARRLGFSRRHVTRLIDHGVLEVRQPPGSSDWKIPLWSVLALEERRAEHDRLTAEWSRDLDAMGAPAE